MGTFTTIIHLLITDTCMFIPIPLISHRQALKEECAQHQRDIEFLQSCLEGEQTRTVYTQPTIKGNTLIMSYKDLQYKVLDHKPTKTFAKC